MAVESVTATALAAFFHLCVPAASGGVLHQSFPDASVRPLTTQEKQTLGAALAEPDSYSRVLSRRGFILLDIKSPYCRIVTQDDAPPLAKEVFLKELRANGGAVQTTLNPEPDAETISALIPLQGTREIAIAFTISREKDAKGFFASAFLVEKKD